MILNTELLSLIERIELRIKPTAIIINGDVHIPVAAENSPTLINYSLAFKNI
jgi:hypothetical protein